MSEDLVTISELDTEERVRERFQNDAFNLYAFFFSH
jgi:hypothetical protein